MRSTLCLAAALLLLLSGQETRAESSAKSERCADWERKASEWAVATYQAALQKRQAEVDALKKGLAEGAKPLPAELAEANKDRGCVLFSRPWQQLIRRHEPPTAEEAKPERLAATAAAGESESLQLGVWALRDLKDVSVRVSDLSAGGEKKLAAAEHVRVLCGYNLYVPKPKKAGAADGDIVVGEAKAQLSYDEVPVALLDLPGLDVAAHQGQGFWIDVAVPKTAEAGEYRGEAIVSAAGTEIARAPLVVNVLPFVLDEAPEWGRAAFISRFRNRSELVQMREHGLNMISWWASAYTAKLEGGKVVADFSKFQEYLKLLDETGFVGPHMAFLGASDPKIENRVMELLGRPTIKDGRNKKDPKVRESFKKADLSPPFGEHLCEILKQFHAATKAVGHGDMKACLLDEPDHEPRPERRDYYNKVFAMAEKGAPDVPLYGVFYHEGDEDRLSHHHDTWCTNRPLARIATMCREKGRNLWTYGFGRQYYQDAGVARFAFGTVPWVFGANGSLLWANYWHEGEIFDPFSVTDTSTMSLPTPEGPLATPVLKGIRECVDDRRYFVTLEKLIASAKSAGGAAAEEAAKHEAFLEGYRKPLFDKMTVRGGRPDFSAVPALEITGLDGSKFTLNPANADPADLPEFIRNDVARRIIALKAAQK
ncbi:MAG: hypothetical protein M5U26_14560 [Planctomycetota bacterium]|nr:hypothetical protein [Planctomycetota bacterium]